MKNIAKIALFLLTFGVYLFTLHPGISPYRDSGDLAVGAATLGVTHPPGYPLYVITGKIFSVLVPFGTQAYRMNVMSAFFGALALFILLFLFEELFGSSLFVSLSVLFFGFSLSLWRLSQVSEMYSFNAFFAAAILLLCAIIYKRPIKETLLKNYFLLAFVCGLALGNHQTIVLLFPGILILSFGGGKFTVKNQINAFMFFLLGCSVYLFLPVRAWAGPVSNWGDPKSLEGFFRMITRSDYGGAKLHPEESNLSWTAPLILSHAVLYLKSLAQQFSLLGAMLGVAGIIISFKDKFFRILFLSFILSGFGFVVLSNLPPAEKTTLPILEPHFVLPNLIFVIFIAAFVARLSHRLSKKIMTGTIVLVLVALLFHHNLAFCNYRTEYFAYDYGKNLMRTLPPESLFYNPDDSTMFILNYFQVVEQKRKDIKLIAYYRTKWGYELLKKKYPELLPTREITSGRELERVILDENRSKYSIHSEFPFKFPAGYASYPVGITYRLSSANETKPSVEPFVFYALRDGIRENPRLDFFTNRIINYYASAHSNMGLAFSNKKLNEQARGQYLMALYIDDTLEAAYNNLGTLEYSIKDYQRAETLFKKLAEINPQSSLGYYNLGLVSMARKDYPRAIENYGKAWSISHDVNAANDLGLVYLELGRLSDAIGMFSKVLEVNQNYLPVYFNLGLAFQRSGDYSNSRKYYTVYMNNVADPAEKAEVNAILKHFPK